MEIYDAGYTNGYWIQRKTSGCATSIVPDYFVFTFSQLVLILTSLISFFIGIRILYRYMRVEERKRGDGGNVVSVNKRFWISNRWKMELIAENLRLNFFSSFIVFSIIVFYIFPSSKFQDVCENSWLWIWKSKLNRLRIFEKYFIINLSRFCLFLC